MSTETIHPDTQALLEDEPPAAAPFKKNAALLRRLGEAVHGYRDRERVVLVGPYKYKPGVDRLIGPFTDVGPAEDYMDNNPATPPLTHGYFGPYDGTAVAPMPPPKTRQVTKVVIHVADPDGGHPCAITLNPDLYDAVFWSQSAVEKFLVPYYTAIGSVDEGLMVRNALLKEEVIALVHLPGSEWVDANTVPSPGPISGSEHGIGLYLVEPSDGVIEDPRAAPVL